MARYSFQSPRVRFPPRIHGADCPALGIGIGINAALFSVLNALFLRPLLYARTNELVEIEQPRLEVSLDDLRAARAFSAVAGFVGRGFSIGSPGQFAFGFGVSANLFRTLGVRPAFGRLFADDDDRQRVAILSYDYWRRTSGDPSAVGRPLTIGGETYVVVGVMPEDFTLQVRDANLFVAERLAQGRLVARLKDGATPAAAQAELLAMFGAQPNMRVGRSSRPSARTTVRCYGCSRPPSASSC